MSAPAVADANNTTTPASLSALHKTHAALEEILVRVQPFLTILQEARNENHESSSSPARIATARTAVALTMGTLQYMGQRLQGNAVGPNDAVRRELNRMRQLLRQVQTKAQKEDKTSTKTKTTETKTTETKQVQPESATQSADSTTSTAVLVKVIIPVHNAQDTIEQAVHSAMQQEYLSNATNGGSDTNKHNPIQIHVCCYDDGSTDGSWDRLQQLQAQYRHPTTTTKKEHPQSSSTKHDARIPATLHLGQGTASRGAGFARNRAVALGPSSSLPNDDHSPQQTYICLLDSDDWMHAARVATQVDAFGKLDPHQRERTLMGCTFARDPPDATRHYTHWCNELDDQRLYLERYRELTIIQPTWMMPLSWFRDTLGGYIEAPLPEDGATKKSDDSSSTASPAQQHSTNAFSMVHPIHDTPQTLRVAEDLRLFHMHLAAGGRLHLCRNKDPHLVTYRHSGNASQSANTPRKLLLQLRTWAFEQQILRNWDKFAVWGAGRDGKDFIKALSSDELRQRIVCLVDVDEKKIGTNYVNRELGVDIPIVHFSALAKDGAHKAVEHFGKLDKSANVAASEERPLKRARHESSSNDNSQKKKKNHKITLPPQNELQSLPVVVCVAMYRTGGALEKNAQSIGRSEGNDLWHFC